MCYRRDVCCHVVARVRVNVAVVVDVNSDAGAFGNLQVPRPRFVADATNARGATEPEYFYFSLFFLCETRAKRSPRDPPDISHRCPPHCVRF